MTWNQRLVVCVVMAALAWGRPAWAQPASHKGPREIEIRWNMEATQSVLALEVWENCGPEADGGAASCAPPGRRHTGMAAFRFELKDTDYVVLVLTAQITDDQRLDAEYAITGVNVDDKAREALKRVFGTEKKEEGAARTGGAFRDTRPEIIVVPVTDDLLAGGRLTATFKKIQRAADGKETVLLNPDVGFRIERRSPWFVFTSGLALVRAPSPSVEIIKTNTVVSFERDGKPQQAFEQVINVKDADRQVRPIDTAALFLNFRLRPDWLYATGGFVANETIFTQPLLGLSARIPIGNSLGLMVTGGVRFTKETEIAANSGFADGQTLDPTLGVTVGDIPTTEARHKRLFFGLSFEF